MAHVREWMAGDEQDGGVQVKLLRAASGEGKD
jgi:hypothetical protein